MRQRRAALAVAAALLFGAGGGARADRSFDVAMVTQPLDGYGMAMIDRAQTPQRFELGLSAAIGWAQSPLRVTLADPLMGNTPQPYNLIEQQVTADLGVSFGLADFLSIAALVPLAYNVYETNALGMPNVYVPLGAQNPTGFPSASGLYLGQPRQTLPLQTTGPRDAHLGAKARFYAGKWAEAGMILEATLPLGGNTAFLGDQGVTFRPRLLGGVVLKRINLALSVGSIVRPTSTLTDPRRPAPSGGEVVLEVGHELTFGGGLGARLHRVVSLSFEAQGTVPLVGDAAQASVSLLGSLMLHPTERLKLVLAGGGSPLSDVARAAPVRVMAGVAFSPSPRIGGLW
ncbi:MAG: hypothetical protein U1A78_32345 [Polyangia bacterium]